VEVEDQEDQKASLAKSKRPKGGTTTRESFDGPPSSDDEFDNERQRKLLDKQLFLQRREREESQQPIVLDQKPKGLHIINLTRAGRAPN
jgi:hypothetical protein